MSEAVDINKPRHQQAQDWGDQLMEQVHWMDLGPREIFLTTALELALEELSLTSIALAVGDVEMGELILGELKEIYGDD